MKKEKSFFSDYSSKMNFRNFEYYSISNNPAVIHGGKILTFRDIDRKASYVSKKLKNYNITNQARIGLLAGNNPLFICTLLGVIKISASVVLFSTNLTKPELKNYLEDSKTQILISDEKFKNMIRNLELKRRYLSTVSDPVLGNFDIWILSHPKTNTNSIECPIKLANKEFILQFTSGTSGKSRIVSRSYNNVINEIKNFTNTISVRQEDSIICPVPLFHAYGLINGFMASFYKGAKLVLMNKFIPNDFITQVKRQSPTIFIGVPFMYSLLCKTYLNEKIDFSSFRLCLSAGAKLSEDIAENFSKRFGVRINQLYGSTETGVMSVNLYKEKFTDVNSVGEPINGRIIKIVDENNNERPLGEEGEIKIKSPATTKGYLYMRRLNQKVFKNGWFYPGDIGKMDKDGNLYITGRKSSFINIAGLKVDPFEIESVLSSISHVKECAVVGIPRKNYGEIIKAYIVAEKDISRQRIIDFCKNRIADYKIPREVEFIEELPRTSTGKLLKKYLIK